jgi:hypothetical protein
VELNLSKTWWLFLPLDSNWDSFGSDIFNPKYRRLSPQIQKNPLSLMSVFKIIL